jgi:phosphoglycerate kinase
MDAPKRPLCVVMGGAKVADKIGVLWSMLDKADVVAVSRRALAARAGRQRAVGACASWRPGGAAACWQRVERPA